MLDDIGLVTGGFHRIRMVSQEDEHLTMFRTRYGQFKYKVMPFGLTNGPAVGLEKGS